MKKLLAVLAAVLMIGMAAPAFAEVDIVVTVTKDKTLNVVENINELWDIDIIVNVNILSAGAAEAKAIAHQTNTSQEVRPLENGVVNLEELPVLNEGLESGALLPDDRIDLDVTITDSIIGNTGEVQFNQDVGNNVNQANLVGVAGSSAVGSVIDSQAEVEQTNTDNFSRLSNTTILEGEPVEIADRFALITGSILDNVGVVQVNQNAGDNNNQLNGLAAAVGLGAPLSGPAFPLSPTDTFEGIGSLGAAVALSEAALGQENTRNVVESFNTVKFDTITNSVNGNSGITSVNQTVGNNNNQGSVIALSAGL